jgi:hypothetical protein
VAVNCREFLALLDAEPDALPPAARAHAAACPGCARAVERVAAARADLRAMGDEVAPPFLAERVLARVRAERRDAAPGARRSWLPRPAPALAAAAVVVGIALVALLRGTPEPPLEARSNTTRDKAAPATQVAPTSGDRAAAPAASSPLPPPRAAVPQAKDEAPAVRRRAAAAPAAREEEPRPAPVAAHEVPAAESGLAATTLADAAGEPDRAAVAPGAVGGVAAPWDANEARERPAEPAEVAFAAAPEPQQVRAKAGASVLARQELAPAGTPANAGGEPAAADAKAEAIVAVAVAPAPADGRPARHVPLREPDAPPPGAAWTVEVSPERALVLRDAAGADISAAHPGTLAALRAAALPPGRWRLSRP